MVNPPSETFANLRRELSAHANRSGFRKEGDIPEDMTFRQWCEHLAASGLKVDRKPFKLSDRPALIPIYDAIPTTRREAANKRIVIQKATQLGLTVWEVLADVYMAKKWGPVNIGMFLPDMSTASFKSEQRFMPIFRSAPMLYKELIYRDAVEGGKEKIGEGNVMTRQIAESILMFLWTSGKVTTESRPMDIVSLDEVQEMPLAQIEKVLARMGDSEIQFALLLSTANIEEQDINFWYRLGNQQVWHTECSICGEMSDLSDPLGIFPSKSITFNEGQVPMALIGRNGAPPESPPENDYVWTCPVCGGHIPDPQHGRYIATNPAGDPDISSFLLPRVISPRMTPRKMITDWGRARTGDQKKNFYNRTLARPYIDADQLPVTMGHCEAAVAEGLRMGVTWATSGRDTFMGVDQMGGFNAVIIKKRMPDGRQAVIHAQAIFDLDPFAVCEELMRRFGVAVCVVEQLPNVNDARKFANKFPGRVFVAGYADLKNDMIVWGDAIDRNDRKTVEEDRSRYSVTLHQYKMMQTALYRIRDCHCLFPDPALNEADVIEDGIKKRIVLLRDWVFLHFTRTALVLVPPSETERFKDERKLRAKVLKVGLDPHFSFANMLCDVAWARSYGNSMVILPQAPEIGVYDSKAANDLAQRMPGLPSGVLHLMQDAPGGTCGRCTNFESGHCKARGLLVQSHDAECFLYEAS